MAHVSPTAFSSSSVVHLHIVFGLPLFPSIFASTLLVILKKCSSHFRHLHFGMMLSCFLVCSSIVLLLSLRMFNFSPAVCLQPKDSGPCKAYFKRWYFDASASKCAEFVYGGCGGNNNLFSSKHECKKTCRELLKEKTVGGFTHFSNRTLKVQTNQITFYSTKTTFQPQCRL